MNEINWTQVGLTVLGSGVAAYIAMLTKIHRLERLLVEIRLQWSKDCETHREKINARIDGKVEKVKDEITGVHSLHGNS